jgi:hypothetical protein
VVGEKRSDLASARIFLAEAVSLADAAERQQFRWQVMTVVDGRGQQRQSAVAKR